jgi:hypothetical protein
MRIAMSAKLVLSLPQGIITATTLSLPELGRHRSPGSGKYFDGRSILVDLAVRDDAPAFTFLDEGGWRDANADSRAALHAASQEGKRTKTALSNNAFSATPLSAWREVYLAKTGGDVLAMESAGELATFAGAECHEHLTPDEIAKAIGQPVPAKRTPRLLMVFCPIELLMLTNLTPAEYIWYSTHRPGKKFRAVAFTEVHVEPGLHLAAHSVFAAARHELAENAAKKTKTVVFGDCFNRVPFPAWVGYDREETGGVYAGTSTSAHLWRFPERIPRAWERAY